MSADNLIAKSADPITSAVTPMEPTAVQVVESIQGAGLKNPDSVNYRPSDDTYACCMNCKYFRGEGVACRLVDVKVRGDNVCDLHEPNNIKSEAVVEAVAPEVVQAVVKQSTLKQLSMVITKASIHNGVRRWAATGSDTDPDQHGEKCSLELFKSFISLFEKSDTKPFLGIAHYPRCGGKGIAGTVEALYMDGKKFKAKGTFADTPMGDALFEAIANDRLSGDNKNNIRISLAWYDLQHTHDNSTVFTRKSLSEACPTCSQGAKIDTYLYGFLDHLAATRVPVNNRTEISLEMKSMAITRKDDADSIVGTELAAELEQAVKGEPTEKSLVIRSQAGLPAEAYALVPDVNKAESWKLRLWEDGENKVTMKQLSNAVSELALLSETEREAAVPVLRAQYKSLGVKAHAFPEPIRPVFPVVTDNWDSFADGAVRLASDPLTREYLAGYINKFKSTVYKSISNDLDELESAIVALSEAEPTAELDADITDELQEETPMDEMYLDTDDPFDMQLINFKSLVEEIQASDKPQAEKSTAIKTAFAQLGDKYVELCVPAPATEKSEAAPAVAPQLDMNALSAVLAQALNPVIAQIGALNERVDTLAASAVQSPLQGELYPQRKSVAAAQPQTSSNPFNVGKSSVEQAVRKSMGLG